MLESISGAFLFGKYEADIAGRQKWQERLVSTHDVRLLPPVGSAFRHRGGGDGMLARRGA